MSFKKIMVLGHVGAKPEIKTLPSGLIVANFSIATNEKFTSKGEVQEKTEWWRIDALQSKETGLVTNVIAKYVTAGTMVMVEGAPQQEEWVDRNTGVKMRGFKIRIGHPGSTLQLCGSKNGAPAPAEGASGQGGGFIPGEGGKAAPESATNDEEIPF